MQRAIKFALAVLLTSCGSSVDDAPAAPASPHAEPAVAPVAPEPSASSEREEPHERESCVPGFARPFTPSAEDLRANQAALALHGRGDFQGSRRAFSALLERAPAYASARFNLACAQARGGQLQEARATLERLLCEDLPTNLPRALVDEDLAPLRSDIEATGARLVRRYRDASEGGAPLIAFGRTTLGGEHGPALVWSQPGLWRDDRFVPAGPRQQGRSGEAGAPMYPAFVTADRVVQVETVSSWAEVDFLPPLRVSERELFSGVERSARRFDQSQRDFFSVRIGVREGQTWVLFDSSGRPPVLETVALASGGVVSNPPVESARVVFDMSRWTPLEAPAEMEVSRRGALTLGSRSIALDPAHRRMSRHHVSAHEGVAVVHSQDAGDCGSPDRFVVEAVDLRSGASLWTERGEGQRLVRFMSDRLWIQTNDALLVFDAPHRRERTQLPTGLGLSSTFVLFNPMC